jgi:hypothetical protein
MKQFWCWTVPAVLTAVVLVLPAQAADENKKPEGKNGDAATPQEIAALAQAGEAVGKIVSVDGSARSLVFRLEYQRMEVQGNGGGNSQNLLRQQQQIMRNPNPVQRAQQMQRLIQQLARAQGNVKLVTEKADFELQGAKDIKVRMRELPPRVGSDGKPQPYTAKEKQDAKGPNPSLPGYQAEFDNLSPGMLVKVTLGQLKAGDDKIPVRMIIIEPEPATRPMTDQPKK